MLSEFSINVAYQLKNIVEKFSTTDEKLVRDSLRMYFQNELEIKNKERQELVDKFGVTSLDKVKNLTVKGSIGNYEFKKAEELTSYLEKIQQTLDELQ